MNPLISFLVILLFLTGFLGGGVAIREFRLPKAGMGGRVTAIVAGLILLISGSKLQESKEISFQITNNLTPGAFREEVTLTLDEKEVGSIVSSNDAPLSQGEFTLKRSGTYSYSLKLIGSYYADGGREVSYSGEGSGIIDVESGDVFEVQGNFQENQIELTLVEK